jgi:hypothetical protein
LKTLLHFLFLLISFYSWGHGNEDHSKTVNQAKSIDDSKDQLMRKYKQINKNYLITVKPIFKKSCFDCHGDTTKYPWYYKIPGVKQLIDHDIKESKKHLDFSIDYPFKSHDTPINDFNAIGRSIRNNSMPPFRYLIMHDDAKLTEKEIKKIEQWINESKEILK